MRRLKKLFHGSLFVAAVSLASFACAQSPDPHDHHHHMEMAPESGRIMVGGYNLPNVELVGFSPMLVVPLHPLEPHQFG